MADDRSAGNPDGREASGASWRSVVWPVMLGVALAFVPSALLIWYVYGSAGASMPSETPAEAAGATGQAPATHPLTLPVSGANAMSSGPSRPMPAGAGAPPPLTVRVELAGAAAADLPESAMIYVFVRPPGVRMPLAVERYHPDELPVSVSFSRRAEDDAVEVVARLSKSGRVQLGSDDTQVVAEVPQDQRSLVSLVIGGA